MKAAFLQESFMTICWTYFKLHQPLRSHGNFSFLDTVLHDLKKKKKIKKNVNGDRVSVWDDENVLEMIVVMVAQQSKGP